MTRGKYIIIEGGDGTGKSTLVQAVKTETIRTVTLQFPSSSYVGQFIRKGISGEVKIDEKAYLYLFAADAVDVNNTIEGFLDLGINVICDRHPLVSGRVFQSSLQSEEQINSVHTSMEIDGIETPDHIFILHAPPLVVIERMKSRAKSKDVVFESYDRDYNLKLSRQYLDIASELSVTVLDSCNTVSDLVDKVILETGITRC